MEVSSQFTMTFTEVMWNSTITTPVPYTGSSSPAWLTPLRFVCEVCFVMPISALGIIGNILSFIVLCHQKQKLSTTVVLQGLALLDTLVLIHLVMLGSLRYVGWDAYTSIYHYLFRWMYPVMYFLRLSSTWLTVLLTVDRFIAVCYPLQAQRLCHRRRTYALIAIVLLFAFVFSFVRFFEYEIVPKDVVQFGFHATDLFKDKVYTVSYRITAFFIFMYLIPMVLLIVLNSRLLCTLKKANAYRATLTQHSYKPGLDCLMNNGTPESTTTQIKNQSRSITIMVIAVVLVCIISNIASMISHVLWSLHMSFETMTYLELPRRVNSQISNVLITINSASNFIIYILCSRKFRTVFLRMFGCELIRKKVREVQGRRKSSDVNGQRQSLTGSLYISLRQTSTKHVNQQGVAV